MSKLISFLGKQEVKDEYLARLVAHKAADRIIQGRTGQDGKGCAVWCTLNAYDHSAYEVQLGIPRIIARLEDRIFEGLTVEDSKPFPINFLSAIPVGVDLTPVWKKFLVWLLVDVETGVIRHAKTDKTRKAIQDVADLINRSLTENITPDQFLEVRRAVGGAGVAYAYAAAAAFAAAEAAAAAADTTADGADTTADHAADIATTYAAYADAADTAAAYAAANDVTATTYAATRHKRYKQMADQLILLLSEAK